MTDAPKPTLTVGTVWAQWLAGERPTLPGVLGDIWRDGFHTATEQMQPRIDRLNAEADALWYAARNPQAVRDETARTLALMDGAQGREADARRRAALDRLQATDPLEYRRVSWLGLTDRAGYLEALSAVTL